MRPTNCLTTSAAVNSATFNLFEPNNLHEEDCRHLLRALEKQAFEHVLYAFRAQGPLTKYKELLLEHIKSALFISDEDFTLHIRIAANNAYLTKIAQELNPSYDNFSEWISAGFDLTGVDLARTRKLNLDRYNSQLVAGRTNNILSQIHWHNRNVQNDGQHLAELYRIPKRPFVPERLRRLLQDTEMDIDGRIDNLHVDRNPTDISAVEPSTSTKKIATKTGVGRPRKNGPSRTTVKPTMVEKKAQQPALPAKSTETHSNTTSANKKTKPTLPLDLKSAKSPEEQAVLAILARSSAQISQQEAAERQMREEQERLEQQMLNNNVAQMEQQMASTSTTAMDNLVEVALAQVPVEIMPPIQLPPLQVPPPSMNLATTTPTHPPYAQFAGGQGQDDNIASTLTLINSTTLQPPPPQHIAVVNDQPQNLMDNHVVIAGNVAGDQSSLTVGAVLKPKKKRSSKHLEEASKSCARVRKFQFEKAAPGKLKPPRGNPDRKPPMKRPCPGGPLDYSNSGPNFASIPISQSYYPQFHPNSKCYSNSQSPQMRVIRTGLGPIIYETTNPIVVETYAESTSKYPTTSNATIQTASALATNNDHSYNDIITTPLVTFAASTSQILPTIVHATTVDCCSPATAVPEVIVVNALPPKSMEAMAVANHLSQPQNNLNIQPIVEQNGGSFNNGIVPTIANCKLNSTMASTSSARKDSASATQSFPETLRNNVVEVSGLDFLASTASLLGPIETNTNK